MSKPKPNTHSKTEDLLDERNATHGSFLVNSAVSQTLKKLLSGRLTVKELMDTRQYFIDGHAQLNMIHVEALDQVCGKMGRIYAGQPTFDDHWDDCSGYMKLPVKFNHGKI